MKIVLNERSDIQEIEVIINCISNNETVQKIISSLSAIDIKLTCRKGNEVFQLEPADILSLLIKLELQKLIRRKYLFVGAILLIIYTLFWFFSVRSITQRHFPHILKLGVFWKVDRPRFTIRFYTSNTPVN